MPQIENIFDVHYTIRNVKYQRKENDIAEIMKNIIFHVGNKFQQAVHS